MHAEPGVVYLVGAGPGDPGLITVRGARLLADADVVAYDRLVDPALLELAPRARHVYVGRAVGDVERQTRIHTLLIEEARAGNAVVRLKGGDPFMFGRGGEECEALHAARVPYEIVPGVSSALAAPAYAGIPVTHRDRASWVAIASGRVAEGNVGHNWTALAAADTGVFLMTVRALGDVVRALLAAGKSPDTPAAVIASATLPGQRMVRGPLGSIVRDATRSGLESPAVLVVGEVAALGERLDWISRRRPLLGRTIAIVRPSGSDPELAGSVRALGAHVVEIAATRIEDPDDFAPLDDALRELSSFAWAVFSSARGVDALAGRLRALGLDARAFAGVKVAAVGPATAGRVRSLGLEPDVVPGEHTGLALAVALGSPAPRSRARRVLLPRPQDAPAEPARALRRAGWRPHEVTAYRTVDDPSGAERMRSIAADAVVLMAASSARAIGSLPDAAVVVCIGPSTANAAREAGLRVDVVAAEHSAAGIIAALREAFPVQS